MRILMTVSANPHVLAPMYLRGLTGAPCQVRGFDLPSGAGRGLRRKVLRRIMPRAAFPEANAVLEAEVAGFRPDAVWIFKGMEIYPGTLRGLRARGITLVNYNPDHPVDYYAAGTGNANVRDAVPLYDLYLTYSGRIAAEMGEKYPGLKVGVIPFGHDVSAEKFAQIEGEEEVVRACLLAAPDADRRRVVMAVAEAGIPLDIYGLGWDRFVSPRPNLRIHPFASGDEMQRVLRRYRVQLNIFRPHNAGSHNMRSFEVPAVGGIMLAEDSPEHRRFFEAGREAFYFTGTADMIAKTREILDMAKDRADEVRAAARRRSVDSGYSYKDRAQAALREIMSVRAAT